MRGRLRLGRRNFFARHGFLYVTSLPSFPGITVNENKTKALRASFFPSAFLFLLPSSLTVYFTLLLIKCLQLLRSYWSILCVSFRKVTWLAGVEMFLKSCWISLMILFNYQTEASGKGDKFILFNFDTICYLGASILERKTC